MNAKLSVKGLTVCTPEFYEVAKQGEYEYEQQAKVDKIIELIEDLSELSAKQANDILRALGLE